jgi:hypothetical protein
MIFVKSIIKGVSKESCQVWLMDTTPFFYFYTMIWIFDIETYINYFSVIFKNVETKELKEFIIFEEKNDLSALYDFITDHNKWFVGYNSYSFDNQLLKFIHTKYFDFSMTTTTNITIDIHTLAMSIIKNGFREYMYNLPFQTIDLMKMARYQKSLKLVGVSMKWPKIQDLPIPSNSVIRREDVLTIRKYNLNDVLITEQLYYKLLSRLKLRAELSELYSISCYTESDSGVANKILEKFYSETTGLEKKYFKGLRTERKFIKFDWVVFPEINFETEPLMHLLEEVKNHTYYKDQPFFKKKVVFDGIEYKLGVGGIHSEDSGAVFEQTDTTNIIDCDISSMYPSLAINHNLTPEHLGNKFMKNFRLLRDKRLKAKREGRKAESEGLKIVLNATIGKTLNEHLWLYDPIVNLRVTINGQLYILMLIEQLVLNGFKVISANTDGVTTQVDKDKEQLYYEVCKKWETQTNFELEYVYYKKYIRRDVNNYLAIRTDGTTKEKGLFTIDSDIFFKSNHEAKSYDKPIISIALYNYFLNDIPIETTIKEHKDIYDFCVAKKIDSKFTNELHYLKNGEYKTDILQKSVRYYVSTNGGVLLKTDREKGDIENYEVNKKVTIFNDYFDGPYNIDYGYYINNAQKIINEIINPQLTLF